MGCKDDDVVVMAKMLTSPTGSQHQHQLGLQAPGTFVSERVRRQRLGVRGGAGGSLAADHRPAHV